MRQLIKACTTFLCILIFFASLYPHQSRAEVVDLQLKEDTMSAKLAGVSLGVALERIKKEKGIWFYGDARWLEEKVSVQFSDLSLEDGLKRILARMNYSLFFDKNKRLLGVIINGKKKPGTGAPTSYVIKHTVSPEGNRENEDLGEAFKVIQLDGPPGGPVEISKEELLNLQVIKNVPTPGGPVEMTEDELESLKVVEGCPTPGGPIETEPEEHPGLTVIKDVSPDGS